MDEVIAQGMPDPELSGLLPTMKKKIDQIKSLTPSEFKIALPDRQGPFNLAHLILGNEVFTAPYTDPEQFHACLQIITDFWIHVRRSFIKWIGPDRMIQWFWSNNIVCECSCNLISPKMYKEHVLPYDLQIAEELRTIAIHPCSGPHVFRETLQHIPGILYTEAGSIEKTAAGAISVEEALQEIGERPIVLGIGQEPPLGSEYESIRAHLDLYPAHPQMSFNYTIMHMRRKDRPQIREIHYRLDDYWESNILPKLKLD
jgi:uroporphyrinogen-III decarboxylase